MTSKRSLNIVITNVCFSHCAQNLQNYLLTLNFVFVVLLSPEDTIHLQNLKSLKDNPSCKGYKKPKPIDCKVRLELGSR